MCEVTPKRCEIACTGACHSVVDYTKYDSSCVAKPMKKETETTLFTTEATQQKQHTTHIYIYIIYTSLAISAHCCLHWCSHRTSIPQFLLRTCRVRHCTTASSLVRAAASPCRVQESPRMGRRYLWSNWILQSRYCMRGII